MTPVLRSIMKSMDSTLRAMKQVDRQANKGIQSAAYVKAERDIKRANNQLIKMNNYTMKANQGMGLLANSSGKVSNNMSRIGNTGFNLVNLASALYLIRNIRDGLVGIMEAPDTALSTQARLGLFNESQYNKAQLYEQVYKTALETRTGLDETGNLATRILISGAMEGEGAATGAIKVTEIINKALIAGGGTAEENQRALLQLSQALASGYLQGDELRAIREQTPYLSSMLAKGLATVDPKFEGVTIGSLKELGGQGELTSERIIKAFLGMEDEINDAFKQMPRTFGQAMTQISSVWRYFLYMLNQGEGALAKVNQKAWEFADFLTSMMASEAFLQGIATGITVLVDAIIWMADQGAQALQFLEQNAEITQAGFVSLGTVAIITAVTAGAAFLAAWWPLILVAGAVGLITYSLLKAGYTAGEVFGYIVGAVLWTAAVIWDAILLAVGGLYFIGATLWDVVQFLISLVWNIIVAIGLAFMTLGGIVLTVFDTAIFGVIGLFTGMALVVLGIIQMIAEALDFVFGSNLADTVKGWTVTVTNKAEEMMLDHNPAEDIDKIKGMWTDGPWLAGDWAAVDPYGAIDALNPYMLDPNQGMEYGKGIGQGIEDYFGGMDFTMGLDSMNNLLDNWDPSSVTMNGGTLDNIDSIGKINSDVEISEEDLGLLKDIAAREFLLNMTAITPQAQISFGDVRETADINQIMDALEDMVENAFATSLVTE